MVVCEKFSKYFCRRRRRLRRLFFFVLLFLTFTLGVCTHSFIRRYFVAVARREERERERKKPATKSASVVVVYVVVLFERAALKKELFSRRSSELYSRRRCKQPLLREREMRRESELLVLVRDARGVREETPLRVHAKFDDEEKITVRYCMRMSSESSRRRGVFVGTRSSACRETVNFAKFPVDRNESSACVKEPRVLTDGIFCLSLSFNLSLARHRKQRNRRRTRNGTRRSFLDAHHRK